MESLLRDLRYGIRALLRNRVYTILAVLALTLGIGVIIGVFGIVDAVLIRPLEYRDSDRLAQILERAPNSQRVPTSSGAFRDWRDQNQVFEEMAAYIGGTIALTNTDQPRDLYMLRTSANYFSMLGVKTAMGRVFLREEDQPGAHRVVVLSNRTWQNLFNGDSSIVGKLITLNNEKYTVVGVLLPDGLFDRVRTEVYIPLAIEPSQINHSNRYLNVYARLKPGVSINQAQVDMDRVARLIADQRPDSHRNWGVQLESLQDFIVGTQLRQTVLFMLGAAILTLLIACISVANLMLTSSLNRQKEAALRAAFGAGRWRVIRQLLTECVVLSFIGGALGVFFGYWLMKTILKIMPQFLPPELSPQLDARMIVFTVGVSLLTGILFGVIPAWQATKGDLVEFLKEGGRGMTTNAGRHQLRRVLIIAEIAIALVVLIGSGLLIRSLLQILNMDLGFQATNVLKLQLTLPQSKYPGAEQQLNFYRAAIERVRSLPGVQSAGLTLDVPIVGWRMGVPFSIEGDPPPTPATSVPTHYQVVTPLYFKTMGIQLVSGREFTDQDAAGASNVAIINQTVAQRFFSAQNPIGKRIMLPIITPGPRSTPPPMVPWEVVGVIKDVKDNGLENESRSEVYLSLWQSPQPSLYLAARAEGDPSQIAPAVREAILAIDKNQPILNMEPMGNVLSRYTARRRFVVTCFAVFASIALLLATIGVYGIISNSIVERTQEIGVRMALGAQPSDVTRLFMLQAIALAAIGIVIGLASALALNRTIRSLLFGVSSTDFATIMGATLLLLIITLAASYFPVRRAVRLNPVVALRHEQ